MFFKILYKYSFILVFFTLFGLFGCDNSSGNNDGSILTSDNTPPVFAPPAGTGNPGTIFIPPANATILSIVPSSGPPDVSTFVTITGTGFLPNTLVTFGGNPATNVTIIDANTLTCNAPLGVANASVNVGVQNLGASQGILPNGFTYVFVVNSIAPPSGTTAGGTAVTITGDGFSPGAQVFFGIGNTAVSVVVVDVNTITCTTPSAVAPGTVDVIVQNTQSEQAILVAGFTYAGFIVTNDLDSGPGSLRQAVLDANSLGGDDSIAFDLDSTERNIVLTGEIVISTNIAILGLGINELTVDGGGVDRIFNITAGIASITNMTITNGTVFAPGGAISVSSGATLDVSSCVISDSLSTTSSFPGGGGICNFGVTTITNCTISGNSADGGGGIFNRGGTLTVDKSTFTGNSTTRSSGGALNMDTGGSVLITNCTISGNTALDFGGAGIRNFGSPLTLVNCTITENTNLSVTAGAGIRNGSTTALENTIIAENIASTNVDVDGTYTSLGFNLIGDVGTATGFTSTGDMVGTSASPIDPLLGPLQNNGGPTDTHALLTGSPAIDAGDPSSTLLEDQRGLPRPVGGVIDIGAVEEQ